MLRVLDDPVVDRLLPREIARACVERAFDLLATGAAHDEPRERTSMDGTTLNVMSAIAPTLDTVVIKSYPVVRPGSSRASVITVLAYTHTTGELRGVVRADVLGRRRTAAAAAVAARAMAREDSATACLFGTGFQGPAQISALVDVLPHLRSVLVVGRSADRAARAAHELRTEHPWLHVESGLDPEDAVPRADVVVTATGAAEPLFSGELLRPGTHVNAIGSNHPRRRELDGMTLRRAARIVVDSRAVASKECGDLLRNDLDPEQVGEFSSVHAGRAPGRQDADEITVFEAHGLAVQDLVCAVHVLDAAEEAGLGTSIGPDGWAAQARHDSE